MSYQLTEQERRDVARLTADQRYDYFTAKVAETGQIWSLRNAEGWVIVSSDDGDECLPIWPHADFAADWAIDEWADCSPEAIALDIWLERWTPGMQNDGTLLAVFPSEEEEGIVATPKELGTSLRAHLKRGQD